MAQNEWGIPPMSALVDSPLDVIFAAFYAAYGNSLATFLRAASAAGENARFSRALSEACCRRKWSVPTVRKYATNIKRILGLLPLPEGFVTSLRIVREERPSISKALGKYGKLPGDDPARLRVEEWISALRDRTRCGSELSLRNVVQFYGNVCLPNLNLELGRWPDDVEDICRPTSASTLSRFRRSLEKARMPK